MASAKKIGEIIASIKAIYPYYAKDSDVDVLAKTWMLLLKDVPDEVVRIAIIKCLQTCKMPPTPADVLEQVREIASINEPSDEEMWVVLNKAVRKSQEHIYNFGHTFIESNGKTQGENAREKFQKIWDELPEKLKTYLGGSSELRRLAGFNDEEMMFEKKNFLKTMPTINKRQEYKELSLLVSGNNDRMLKDGQN
jgi:hypothetical protein